MESFVVPVLVFVSVAMWVKFFSYFGLVYGAKASVKRDKKACPTLEDETTEENAEEAALVEHNSKAVRKFRVIVGSVAMATAALAIGAVLWISREAFKSDPVRTVAIAALVGVLLMKILYKLAVEVQYNIDDPKRVVHTFMQTDGAVEDVDEVIKSLKVVNVLSLLIVEESSGKFDAWRLPGRIYYRCKVRKMKEYQWTTTVAALALGGGAALAAALTGAK